MKAGPAGPARPVRVAVAAVAGLVALLAAFAGDILQGAGGIPAHTVVDAVLHGASDADGQFVLDLRLPRAVAGIVAGAALGLAAVLLQAITRNRLADPSTLGLSAGGQLAVTLVAAYGGFASDAPTILVAFAGVLFAGLVIGGIGRSAPDGPLRLVLAGTAVGLAFSAIVAAIQLVRENETSALFLWGGGTLIQAGWEQVRIGAIVGGLAAVAALALGRRLDVAALGEQAARSLGLRAARTRLLTLAVAAVLVAVAVGVAGPLAFVGLGAAHIARVVARPRSTAALLALSALVGAVIVLAADVLGRLLLGAANETPVGVVCALIGAPALVLVARSGLVGSGADGGGLGIRARRRPWLLWLPPVLAVAAALAGLCFGELGVSVPAALGAVFGFGDDPLADLAVDLRGPRLAVALVAGACLAASGTALQATVRNPLASPELLGVTGGASVAAFAVILVWSDAPGGALPAAAFAGGMAALFLVLLASGRGSSPGRLILVGVAVTAFCAGVTTLMVLHASPAAASALVFLAGSTYGSDGGDLAVVGIPALVLIPLVLALTPWMDVMALGDDAASALGLPRARARVVLLLAGGALACVAVAAAGTIAFVGLVAPHAARLVAGGSHRRVLLSAMALGAALLAAADVVGRLALPPTEVPSGIVVALIGAPYLAWLMSRSRGAAT
ncbi:Petrobactin import system permease protein FpuB [Paraconexibacter sp. AEG42_29]|uniref:Petrobactin import system permease protein FpuB n=1 Tax=Paraconexibacter sp. AEG42_29 TaxID=2997339 RepID=A0AAU7B2M0_9ACTN